MNIKKLFIVLGVALLSATLILVAHSASAAAAPAAQAGGPAVVPETCGICHKDTGAAHQASYDKLYQDGVIKVTDLKYSFKANPNTYVVKFKMTMNGQKVDASKVESVGIYYAAYDAKLAEFVGAVRVDLKGKLTYDAATGETTSTKVELDKADKAFVELKDVSKNPAGIVVLYGRDKTLGLLPARINQAMYPFAALQKLGKVDYASAANASGCENCHSKPYLKHGYIYAELGADPTTDFVTCKACHLDDGEGGHFEWQLKVDDPIAGADFLAKGESAATAAIKAKYGYKTNLMNDVHMSHAMEFPYPQSMSSCVTCHEGKLDTVLADANFQIATCKSCHPAVGAKATDPKDDKVVLYDTTKLALKTILPPAVHGSMDLAKTDCTTCHGEGKAASSFKKIHSGYDKAIYTADGKKYSDLVTVSIDKAAFADNKLTINFSAALAKDFTGVDVAKITPTVMVSLYGWDTKDFIIGAHERLIDDNGDKALDSKDSRNLEYILDGKDANPRFKTVTAAGGKWQVTADLTAWADMIKDGSVKRVEIAVMPAFTNADKVMLALIAPSKTFDLGKNAFDAAFYKPIVKAGNCDTCHDALSTTFHSADRSGNVVVCRMCHITKAGGSHLEQQSRSIDSYVHAIHSAQQFDVGAIDFSNPVLAEEYSLGIEMPFPRHGTDCESCHVKGTYEVPDQSKSLPGILSASSEPKNKTRGIGPVKSVIVGPGTRACGSCHKAELINQDSVGWFAMLNQHLSQGGYTVEVGDKPADTLMGVIKQMMSMFK